MLVFNVTCLAQSPGNPKNNKPGGVVTGRVTAGGKSLAGVPVVIGAGNYYNDVEPAARTTTDADGRFHLSGIPAGTYQVTPLAAVFVAAGQSSAFDFSGKAVVVAEGESIWVVGVFELMFAASIVCSGFRPAVTKWRSAIAVR